MQGFRHFFFDAIGVLHKPSLFSNFKGLFRIQSAKKLDDLSNDTGPSGLMACSKSGTIVAMEVFVKKNIVAPVRISLEFLRAAKYWSLAILIAGEDAV